MKIILTRIKVLFWTYIALVGSIWGFTEAYTYFTDNRLRVILGNYWMLVFFGCPFLVALVVAVLKSPKFDRTQSEFFTVKGREEVQRWGRKLAQGIWDWHPLGIAVEHYMDAIRCDPTHQHPYTKGLRYSPKSAQRF